MVSRVGPAAASSQRPGASSFSVSIIVPVFNEQVLVEQTVQRIADYAAAHLREFDVELIVVNDGSTDETAQILGRLKKEFPALRVIHHPRNRGAGSALKSGFQNATGDYVVTLDADLSYDVDHIGRLLAVLLTSHADVVLASPYMPGGSIKNVPALRLLFSRCANYFLSKVSQGDLSTHTCMVRGYRNGFLQRLVLRATDMDLMPETVYKTQVLKGVIEETPGDLDWERQNGQKSRRSSMRMYSHVIGTALTGFMIRPFLFLLVPGVLFGLVAAYCGVWMIIHTAEAYAVIAVAQQQDGPVNVTEAVALAFADYPHTFVIGLLSLILTLQLIGLALLALQSKKYFEHLFYLTSNVRDQLSGAAARTPVDAD